MPEVAFNSLLKVSTGAKMEIMPCSVITAINGMVRSLIKKKRFALQIEI